jgi:hypothetical protein
MADIPVKGALRGAVKPPNEEGPRGDRRANGYLPLAGGTSECKPPNTTNPGDHRVGSFPLSERTGEVKPPNHRLDVGMAKMPQPGSAAAPGKGAVPVGAGNLGLPASAIRAKK